MRDPGRSPTLQARTLAIPWPSSAARRLAASSLTLGPLTTSSGETPSASAMSFLAPLFGVLSAWAVLGEDLTPGFAAGAGAILVGLYLTNRARRNVPCPRSP